MQTIQIIVTVLALLATTVPLSKTGVSVFSLQKRRATAIATPPSSETAAIEAYRKMLDGYFKDHPTLTRYYVDNPPSGKPDSPHQEWYEVKNLAELGEAEGTYANASIIVSTKDGEIVYVDVGDPHEHYRHDDEYYFRSNGTLCAVSSVYESNVAGARIKRENLYGPDGKLIRATTQCFTLTTSAKGTTARITSCNKAVMRAELGDYKIPVYKKNTDLPGGEILKRR